MKHYIFDRVARPWIGKKIREYMGVVEPNVVQHIMKMLNARPVAEKMRENLKSIMYEKRGEIVLKLWQTLIFEEMKVVEGLYTN